MTTASLFRSVDILKEKTNMKCFNEVSGHQQRKQHRFGVEVCTLVVLQLALVNIPCPTYPIIQYVSSQAGNCCDSRLFKILMRHIWRIHTPFVWLSPTLHYSISPKGLLGISPISMRRYLGNSVTRYSFKSVSQTIPLLQHTVFIHTEA